MKSFFSLSLIAAVFAAQAALASTPIEKRVPVDHVYAPFGFDSNDRTEVVISGHLPNLCHRSPSTTVKIEGNVVKVEMTSLYYETSNPFCPEVIVPFVETVNLGVLEKGNYKVEVNGGDIESKLATVSVSESTSEAVDDFIYAGVEYVERPARGREVVLKGYNPSDCFELESIEHYSNGKDALSLLPKMKKIRDFCPMKMIPFEYKYEVPRELNKDVVLLHVRKMEGKSVNVLFNNKQ